MVTKSRAGSFRSESFGLRVGLTGGIGSGKSAVADQLGSLGAAIIDTDLIARALTGPNGAAMDALTDAFGSQFVSPTGALDRSRMRDLAFRDAVAKQRLEGILHPLIRDEALSRARSAASSAPYLVFVVPLLVESLEWRQRVDRLLVIDCTATTQLKRVSASRRLDSSLVRSVIKQQAPRAARLDAADDILVNEDTLDALALRVQRLHRHYCVHAAGRKRKTQRL